MSARKDLDAHFLAADMGHNDDDQVAELLDHPLVHVGASDGGAHILSFSTYGDTGYLLGHFVRDTGKMELAQAVKKITSDTAAIWGIPNRGLLKPGYVADVTIFDRDSIDRGAEYFVNDVPGDGNRYVRDSIGIDTVLVGGDISWDKDSGYSEAANGEVLPHPLS